MKKTGDTHFLTFDSLPAMAAQGAVTELPSHHSTRIDEADVYEIVRATRACESEIFNG